MNSAGISCVVNSGHLMPEKFLDLALAECTQGFSYSIVDKGKMDYGFFGGEAIEKVKAAVQEMNTKFKDRKLVLFFNRLIDPQDLCQQPYPVVVTKDGTVLVTAFADGEFKKYETDKELDPGSAFIMRYFGDELSKKMKECGGDPVKLFKEIEREDFRKNQWEHLEPRGCIYLHNTNDDVRVLSRHNGLHGQWDWGSASNHLGYKEEKAAEPAEDVMPEGLTYMEKQKWLSEQRAKAAAKPATAKAKEPASNGSSKSTSTVAESKHPEGGTEVKLDPKLGIIDGRVVRAHESVAGRVLKEWYKSHDKNGCPQNYNNARPGIPFERLKPESSIRKFLEASGLFVTGISAKTDDDKSTGKSTGGLTPSQIASAVIVHKNATYIVDPDQFKSNEKEHPTFLERLGISLTDLVCMSSKDKVALLKIVGDEVFMHDITIEIAKLKPELTKRVESITSSDPQPQPEPEKEVPFEDLPYMEQLKRRAAAKKTAA